MRSTKIGAVFFALWGVLHVIGGGLMLATASGSSVDGYAMFNGAAGDEGPLAGAILQYHSFNLLWFGVAATVIAITLNWRNSRIGLFVNLAITGLADIGLVLFMLIPGYLGWLNGAQGLGLFALAAIFSIAGYRAAPELRAP